MEFQVRSESTGLREWPTLAEAFQNAKDDTTIWKISFTLPNGERVRLEKNNNGQFVYSPLFI